MSILNSKELTLVYDGTTYEGKKALAYAYSLSPRVNKQDVSEVHLSTTFLRQVIEHLNVRPKDLMNRAHPFYQKHVRGRDYDTEGWLHVLARNPQLLKAPIALLGDRAVICEPASNIQTLSGGQCRTKVNEGTSVGAG
jgi:arsenate reductase (glutaredoxin)